MNERSTTSSPRSRGAGRGDRRATTLIEVIAGLVVLGTVLASVVVGARPVLAQARWRTANSRAVEAADRLVEGGPQAAHRLTPCPGSAPAVAGG